jgi:hypothetical protein
MRARRLERNCGTVDRALRLLLGIGLLGLYGALEPPGRYLTLLGFPLIATAVTGFCPLYALLGVASTPRKGRVP